MIAPSRAETGNRRCELWQDEAEPDRFVLDKLYADHAAIAAQGKRRTSKTTPEAKTSSRSAPLSCSSPQRSPNGASNLRNGSRDKSQCLQSQASARARRKALSRRL